MSKDKKATGVNRTVSMVVFPLLLFLFSLIGARQGADLSDTMYSAGNYAFYNIDASSWHFATFLANLTGRCFFLLAGGRLMWLKALCSLVPAGTAVLVYFLLKDRIHPYLLFPALIIALGLNWSPSVILYQHLSYLALTAGALILFHAMKKKKRLLLLLAGLVLGLGLGVRISNLTHCALIVYVIWEDIRAKQAKRLAADILCCIGGYAAGAALVFLLMFISGGAEGIARMSSWISDLLGGSSGEGCDTLKDMLLTTADNYLGNLRYALIPVAGVAAGSIMFKFIKPGMKAGAQLLYTCGVALIFIYYFRNGVFDLKYYNVGAIFRISVVMLILFIPLDIWVLIDKKFAAEEKALALLALITQLITPLGSNNHLYSCINDMYLLMPVAAHLFAGLILRRGRDKCWHFPMIFMGVALSILMMAQSVMFHLNFAFKDGTNGKRRNTTISAADGLSRLEGMQTTALNAEALKNLAREALNADGDSRLLTYGDIPGMNYILDMPPAVSTAWPDLESYSADQYREELAQITGEPLCIMTKEADKTKEADADKKLLYLRAFLYNNGYERVYDSDDYVIYERK